MWNINFQGCPSVVSLSGLNEKLILDLVLEERDGFVH
jgi:hypothetical protein